MKHKTELCSSTDKVTVNLLVRTVEAKRSYIPEKKIMENHYADLFRITFMKNCFVLFLSFTAARSAPHEVTPNIIDIMKNDSNLCPAFKFIYESENVKPCASVTYPVTYWKYNPETLNSFLCLGVYDTAYKICQYSSQLSIPLNSTATFNSYVEKYVPNDDKAKEDFCNNLQGLTSLYTKVDQFWRPLVQSLNRRHTCERICFDFQNNFRPLCAVFAWIKSIDDDMMKRVNKVETKYDSHATDKPHVSQSKGEITSIETNPIEAKKIEIKEFKEQDRKQITAGLNNNNNNVKEDNLNMPPSNPLLADSEKLDEEKTKSDTEKVNTIQKKINNTSETQVHKLSSTFKENKPNSVSTELGANAETKPIKNIPSNGDSQAPSRNNAINNKVANEEDAEKSKGQNIDDIKPSTISENTQEHYDAGNPDDNLENDGLDDIDDTIQHPETGNQNENIQEVSERKNNNARIEYSNMRVEDDSHFFTYFTVITLACLAGYIGYHNKQKILAIVLEGRRSRNNRSRRRPSTASYRKLDCTLEEAVTSQCNANVTHVIY